MKLTTLATLAIIAIAALPASALADSTTVRPDGAGGYLVTTHGDISQGTVTVRPDGAGGFIAHQSGGETITIRSDGAGGYIVHQPGIDPKPVPSWVPSILPQQ